jgi:hypothetical protein
MRVTKAPITNNTGASLAGLTFGATVTCDGVQYNVSNIAPGAPGIVTGIAVGAMCSVTEVLPPPPSGGNCPRGQVPTWDDPPAYQPPTVQISNGAGPAIEMRNTLNCAEPKPKIVPHLVACPLDQMYVPGIGCTTRQPPPPPPSSCAPPMVPGPVKGSCVCPSGMTKKGENCVEPTKKRERKNERKKERKKNEPDRRQTDITLPRGIPGVGFPGGGGGYRGGDSGRGGGGGAAGPAGGGKR